MTKQRVVVIGAGMAGASIAAELAAHAQVTLLEMESQPGYHTTGRSAALYAASYGSPAVRAITRASRAFFDAPDAGFVETPLLQPRGAMFIARADQHAALQALQAELADEPAVVPLDVADALRQCVLLRSDYMAGALLDRSAMDIDVHALHQGYLKQLKARGGEAVMRAEVRALGRADGLWRVDTRAGHWAADVVVNAAGAWADVVGEMAGASPIGLVPKRRTAMTVPVPDGLDVHASPAVIDCEEQFYLRPEAGKLLISPADETPSPPCDAQPEELDMAIAVDRIETAFELQVRRIDSKWAGLRSFVADKSPVVGFDPEVPAFFWFAGQGGYGIQMAPALARIGAAWALGQDTPADVLAQGLDVAAIQPERLRAG